jgi:DNA-binding GntR family transcriptional regulator
MQEILRLRTAAEPYLRMTIRMSPTAFSNTVAEHEVLVRCAKDKDVGHAEAVMRAHILGGDIDLILASAGQSEKDHAAPAGAEAG